MTPGNLDETDPTFKADLRDSERAVWIVARWLQRRGNNVTVRAVHVRPTVADIGEYGDDGDLEIIHRLEVKHRSLMFTGAADYPYPSVMVDNAHAWDRAQPKPYAYVILNQAATVAAIIEGRSAPQWRKASGFDRRHGRDRTFYFCPLALVKFLAIPAEVRA